MAVYISVPANGKVAPKMLLMTVLLAKALAA